MQSAWVLLMFLPAQAQYPKGEMLVEAAALKAMQATDCTILDVRSEKEFFAGHVPGANSVNMAELSKAFATVTEPKAIGMTLGKLGIDATRPIVVYGDDVLQSARCWFLIRAWGLSNVRLLNGGWAAWKAAEGQVSTDSPKVTEKLVKAMLDEKRYATKDFVLNAIKNKSAQIMDARSEKEFCGEAGAAKRRGAIPGAVHLEWSNFVEKESQRFKPASELTKLLQDAGIDPTKPVITYCQSGGRAAVAAFVVELMGGKDVRNYYRSWAEWGNAEDTPVEKGKK